MTDNNIAWFAGLIVTMIAAAIYVILLMTRDYSPIERRARRLTILASIVGSVAIWGVTLAIYLFVSELIGNFLVIPSIGLTGVGVWHISRTTYRKMGGGKESQDGPSQQAGAGS